MEGVYVANYYENVAGEQRQQPEQQGRRRSGQPGSGAAEDKGRGDTRTLLTLTTTHSHMWSSS